MAQLVDYGGERFKEEYNVILEKGRVKSIENATFQKFSTNVFFIVIGR